MRKRKLIPLLIIPVLFGLFLFQNIKLAERFHKSYGTAGVITSDAFGYYEYLPTIFIRKTPENLKCGLRVDKKRTVNKYTCGVAILQSPFFFANHSIQTARGFSGTGFENSYGHSIIIATSFYVFLGVLMLFAFLKKRFGFLTGILSVVTVVYGTNMFHYIYAEPGLSHAYSFFCMAGILFFTDRFYATVTGDKIKLNFYLIAIAFLISLAVLIRQTSVVMLLFFVFYDCYSFADIKKRLFFFIKNYLIVVLFFLVAIIVWLPQIYYWNLTTGNFLVFTYGLNNETFSNWNNPPILQVLFGRIAGWLTYSPVMVFSFFTLFVMVYKKKYQALSILIVFIVITYICASWWAYNFLCAFGYRSFIEYYPLFVIPLAYLIHSILQRRNKSLTSFSMVILAALVYTGLRMNFSFETNLMCDEEIWLWSDYWKLYDKYF